MSSSMLSVFENTINFAEAMLAPILPTRLFNTLFSNPTPIPLPEPYLIEESASVSESAEPNGSKKPPMTQTQAAIKIQRCFRNKLVASEPHLIAQADDLMRVSEANLYDEHPAEIAFAEQRWEKLKTFATSLEEDHYIFAHSSSFFHSFFIDMRTHLSSETLFPAHSSRWDTHRKFRPQNTPITFENTDDYFKSDLCIDINSGVTKDDEHRSLILSCDGYLDNKEFKESAYYFFRTNSNIYYPDESFKESFFEEHIQNADIRKFMMMRIFDQDPFLFSRKSCQGRIYLIAIPKQTITDQKMCYAWRSHAFGVLCPRSYWSALTFKDSHREFLEVLDKHQKEKTVFHYHHGLRCQAQYRLLAHNLDKDPTKKVFVLDSLSHKQNESYKKTFWKLANLLKQCQRLESISEETDKETLVSILLRIRFDVKYLLAVTPEMETIYLKGLIDILNSKKSILINHADYLKESLPSDLLENLEKIGISLI